MFDSKVVYIKGTPEELKRKVNSLIKRYGCMFRSSKTYDDLQPESVPARTICLRKDLNDKNCKGITIYVITENIESRIPNSDNRKRRIVGISHEIRHVVDKIVEPRNIKDLETPAYLTGYLSGELLVDIKG